MDHSFSAPLRAPFSIASPTGCGRPSRANGQPIERLATAQAPGHSPIAGILPRHRLGTLELESYYEPCISVEWLMLEARRRDRQTGVVVETVHRVCRSLPLLQPAAEREMHVRETCLLIEPFLRSPGRTLISVLPAFEAICGEWDLLAAHRALKSLDEAMTLPASPPPPPPWTAQEIHSLRAALTVYVRLLATDDGWNKLDPAIRELACGANSSSPLPALGRDGVELLQQRLAQLEQWVAGSADNFSSNPE